MKIFKNILLGASVGGILMFLLGALLVYSPADYYLNILSQMEEIMLILGGIPAAFYFYYKKNMAAALGSLIGSPLVFLGIAFGWFIIGCTFTLCDF